MIESKVEPSLTLALLERVRQMRAAGEDVASFAAGEPDFPTPPVVIAAAHKDMKAGDTRYVATPGVPRLREAIAADYRKRLKAPWVESANVLVTGGAKQGIYLALAALLERGDEVLMPAPYWVSYPHLIHATGGKPVVLECRAEEDFFPTVAELEAARTSKTRALIFSSPGNPTGCMITKEKLAAIIDWCFEKKVTLIYDEIYERLELTDRRHVCPLALCDEKKAEFVLCVNAASKSLAMTGWRLGYIVSHRGNVKGLSPLHGQMITCLPGFIQEGARVGLGKATQILKPVLTSYKRRRKLMMDGFKKIPGVEMLAPRGSFYICADVRHIMKRRGLVTDSEFAEVLLHEEKTVVIPGDSMGMPGWLRFSFATSDKELKEGLKRFARFCAKSPAAASKV